MKYLVEKEAIMNARNNEVNTLFDIYIYIYQIITKTSKQ